MNTCKNYKDQLAIDKAIREANKNTREQLYVEGTMLCDECGDASNEDWLADLMDEMHGGNSKFHRICYQ